MIESKTIQGKKSDLGQFMTPIEMAKELTNKLPNGDFLWIEPSFGQGSFVSALLEKNVDIENIIGVEIDCTNSMKIIEDYPLLNLHCLNFYDFNITTDKEIHIIGNPPFRSPAYSFKTHNKYVKSLAKHFSVVGMREEAVFFILKATKLLEENNGGYISFILPHVIFTNDSKFYKTFKDFLSKNFDIIGTEKIDTDKFIGVNLDMVWITMKYNKKINTTVEVDVSDIWNYKTIFKRTYLGSVPTESILLSSKNEPKESFLNRMRSLFLNDCDINLFEENIRYNGQSHLKILNSKDRSKIEEKLVEIYRYYEEIKSKFTLEALDQILVIGNIKEINHRNEMRYYLRCNDFKKLSFVYEINPKPCESFYFTGNPSKTSTDYYGYCSYDITRNSSPGACRTIPIEKVEDNLTDEFKIWWDNNFTNVPYNKIFDYITTTYKSNWYKEFKKKNHRFYFGFPKNYLITNE
jgi:hypothetical protein